MATYTYPKFTITVPSVEEILSMDLAGVGSLYGNVKVEGYWSDVINVYIRFERTGKMDIEVSHSSGGRDTDQVKSSIESETNFGSAMIATCSICSVLEAHSDELGAHYKSCVEKLNAKYKAEREEYEAKAAADPAITEEKALSLFKQMNAIAKSGQKVVLELIKRGSGAVDTMTMEIPRGKANVKTTFGYYNYNISRSEFMKTVVKYSDRSVMKVV